MSKVLIFISILETHRDSATTNDGNSCIIDEEDNKLVGQVKSIECLNDFCVAYNDKVTQDVYV